MSKSKRKRQSILAREFSIDELLKNGLVIPDHIKDMKNPRKHFFLEDYNNSLGQLSSSISALSNLIGNPVDYPDEVKQPQMLYNQIFIARSMVIQYFVILDSFIGKLLCFRQSDQGVPSSEIKNYTEIKVGLKELLLQEEKNSVFEKMNSRIDHYRVLRNQFAHYPAGTFQLGANKESFESFVQHLKGINCDSKNGYHVFIDGKPGFTLPYSSSSGEYLNDLIETGTKFIHVLSEIFLPDMEK